MGGKVELEYPPLALDEQFKADFNLDFYDFEVSYARVEWEVRAFLGEKLLQPRSEDLFIGRDGRLDPNYLAMMQRSIDYWRERRDRAAVERFESELTGMRNLAILVIEHGINDQPLPIVLTASDPGTFYVDANGRKKSATFVGLLDRAEEDGWRYKIFSLPTKHIGLNEHKEILWAIGNIETTKQILGASIEELTANNLVAFPVLLDQLTHSLDELAIILGYESWEKIEEVAADQLALQGDTYAMQRREAMIVEFTTRILELIRQNRGKEEKEALVNAMGDMFALEAGKEYLSWGEDRIRTEIAKNVRVALADKLGVFKQAESFDYYSRQYDLGDWGDLYAQVRWMMNAFRTNPLAQEARATGCGGSGINYQQGMGWDSFSVKYQEPTYSGFEMLQDFGYTNTPTSSSDDISSGGSEPEGRHKGELEYRPGICGHCGQRREKVGYSKNGGGGCSGWCTKCEHADAAGGE